jgi:thiamine-phosphate pyrophosphorylase
LTLPRLHIVTDDATLARPGFVRAAEALLAAGGARIALHLRGHATAAARLFEIARSLTGAASRSGTTLLVNDRIDVALCAGVNGVQLGRRSVPVTGARRLLPRGLIGYSAHGAAEAATAVRDTADFVIAGAIWPTPTHPGDAGGGTELLRGITRGVDVPVIAIGGVTAQRVAEAVHANAHGVAVLSGVWAAEDTIAAMTEYLAALDGAATRS